MAQKSQELKKVGECLYRNGNKTYFALLKVAGKQIKKSLKTDGQPVIFFTTFLMALPISVTESVFSAGAGDLARRLTTALAILVNFGSCQDCAL